MDIKGFRQEYPQYNELSDFQVIDRLYKRYPQYSELGFAEFGKRFGVPIETQALPLPGQPEPEPEEGSDIGRLQTAAGSFVGGLGEIVGQTIQSQPIVQQQFNQFLNRGFDLVDQGITENDYIKQQSTPGGLPYNSIVRDYFQADEGGRAQMRQKYAFNDPRGTSAYQFGEDFIRSGNELIPTNPEYNQEFIAGSVPRALGNMAAFLTAARVGTPLAPVMMGSESLRTQGFADALAHGADLDTAFKASNVTSMIGYTEALPVLDMLRRADKASGGMLTRILKNAAITGTEEAIQESTSQVLQNLTAQNLYDPDRDTFMGAQEGAEVGGAAGAISGLLTSLIGGRRVSQAPPEEVMPPLEPEPESETPTEARAEEPLSMFVGEKARGAPKGKLEEAKELEKKGTATPSRIWDFTGWWKGPEGRWRYEIDDSQATLAPLRKGVDDVPYKSDDYKFEFLPISDVLAHDTLFDRYPELERIQTNISVNPENQESGVFYYLSGTPTIEAVGPTVDSVKSVLLHELQHAVQEIEGFARGGNANMFRARTQGINEYGINAMMGIVEAAKKFKTTPAEVTKDPDKYFHPASRVVDETVETLPLPGLTIDLIKNSLDVRREIAGYIADPAKYRDHAKRYKLGSGNKARTSYARLAGEVEARNTEARRNMSEEERALLPPHLTQDVMDSRTIIHQYEKGQADSEKILHSEAVQAWKPGPGHIPNFDLAEGRIPRENVAGVRKPFPRQKVIRRFAKRLKLPIYEGQMQGIPKGVLGHYYPGRGITRIRKQGDLAVAAHEIAHMLDDTMWNRFKERGQKVMSPYRRSSGHPQWKTFQKELKSVSYDVEKDYEGFAEFMRLWMTDPESLKDTAPQFLKFWEDFVATDQEYGPAIMEARDDFIEWTQQGALNRARSKIGPTPSISDKIMTNRWDEFRQSTLDRTHGFYLLEKSTTGEIAEGGLYETARLAAASYSIIDGALRFGYPVRKVNGDFTYKGKGLLEIIGDATAKTYDDQGNLIDESVEDFLTYAVGVSAQELMGQGRENLFTKDEIQAMLDLETPSYKKAFEEYQEWNNGILDFAQDMGYLNPTKRKAWKRNFYVPFYRVGKPQEAAKKQGIEGLTSPTKMLTGGTGNLNDIMDNMIRNASRLIDETLKNDVRIKAINTAQRHIDGGKWLAKVNPRTLGVNVSKEEILRNIVEPMGIDMKTFNAAREGILPVDPDSPAGILLRGLVSTANQMEDYVNVWQFNQAPNPQGIVAVLKNGKPEYYQVSDSILYRAFQGLNPQTHGALINLGNLVRRVGQSGVVLTPDFMVRNIARDTIHAAIFTKTGFIPFIDTARGFKSRIMQDANYKDFIANGGGMSSYMVDPETLKARADHYYRKKGINRHLVANTTVRTFHALQVMADAFEMATRLGEFKRAKKRGKTSRTAAYYGREVSTDFAMRGDNKRINEAYNTIMFLKAGMNGLDRGFRGFAVDANKYQIMARTGLLAIGSMALYLMNRDIEEYQDLEDWDRDTHWHIYIPKEYVPAYDAGDNKYLHLRFPKIWEIGAIASLAERGLEGYLDGMDSDKAWNMGKILATNFMFEYVPQALKPVYEIAINENRFTGSPIETYAEKQLMPEYRFNHFTSETAKALGKQLGMSPKKIDALIKGYFNTWGMYGLQLMDEAFWNKNMPERDIGEYPVMRTFRPPQTPRRTKHSEEFWIMFEEYAEANNTANMLSKSVMPEEYAKVFEENAQKIAQGQILEFTKTEVDKLYDAMDAVRNSDMHPSDKREKLDELQTSLNAIYKQSMEAINEEERNLQ